MKHVDVLIVFMGLYKILEFFCDIVCNQSKWVIEVEKQVKFYEVKILEFVVSFEEVCGEMMKLQSKMVEMVRRVVKELSGKEICSFEDDKKLKGIRK